MNSSTRSAVLAVSALAFAATLGQAAPAAAQDEVPVGILLPLSGSVAPIGINNRRGHELAVEEINADGGIKALGGAKLVLIDGDTQGNPNVGISEVEKLARRDVVAIMGAYQSGVTFPTTQMAERLGVPYIDPVAIADSITEGRGFKYTFKIAPKASWYARDQVRFLVETSEAAGEPAKSVVLMHEDTLFGTSTAEGQVAAAKEFGLEVLDSISYPKDTADITSTIARVKDLDPDAVLLVSYINDAVLITKTMKELDVNIPIIGTSAGHIDPAYIDNLGKDADLTFTVGEWNADIDKAGVGAAVLNASRQVGGSLGIALIGAIMAIEAGGERTPKAFVEGLQTALLV
ncbi:MAG: ABC transporter substrate-binding protein, partial [Tistlia sp.]